MISASNIERFWFQHPFDQMKVRSMQLICSPILIIKQELTAFATSNQWNTRKKASSFDGRLSWFHNVMFWNFAFVCQEAVIPPLVSEAFLFATFFLPMTNPALFLKIFGYNIFLRLRQLIIDLWYVGTYRYFNHKLLISKIIVPFKCTFWLLSGVPQNQHLKHSNHTRCRLWYIYPRKSRKFLK